MLRHEWKVGHYEVTVQCRPMLHFRSRLSNTQLEKLARSLFLFEYASAYASFVKLKTIDARVNENYTLSMS